LLGIVLVRFCPHLDPFSYIFCPLNGQNEKSSKILGNRLADFFAIYVSKSEKLLLIIQKGIH